MDSKDRNEFKIRRREETLARRMGEALDRIDPRGAAACPDAEILAAYAEQALAPDEAAQWEGHFAACGRCRKILRVLAASADTPLAEKEVAQLGGLISAVHSPVEIKGKPARQAHPKLIDWRTRWLAPALGVAAALAVWFAMRPPWRARERSATQTLIAQAPQEETLPLSTANPTPMESERLSRPASQQDQKTHDAPDILAGNSRSLNSPPPAPAERFADADNALKKGRPSGTTSTGAQQKEEKSRGLADKFDTLSPTEPASPQPPRAKAALGPPAASTEARTQISATETAPRQGFQRHSSQIRNRCRGGSARRDNERHTWRDGAAGKYHGRAFERAELPGSSSTQSGAEIFRVIKNPFRLDALARRTSRNDRAFHRRGKNMAAGNQPIPGRLAGWRGSIRHGLLARRPQWRDCAHHGWESVGTRCASSSGRACCRKNGGLDRHHGAR